MLAHLAGKRVLIVEDEMAVALLIEDFLDELGLAHLGLALLDINLNGEASYPIARGLDRLGIPFVFVTGYDDLKADARWEAPRVTKPFRLAELEAAMVTVLEHRFSRRPSPAQGPGARVH